MGIPYEYHSLAATVASSLNEVKEKQSHSFYMNPKTLLTIVHFHDKDKLPMFVQVEHGEATVWIEGTEPEPVNILWGREY